MSKGDRDEFSGGEGMSEWNQGVLSEVAEIVMGQSPRGETLVD